MTVFVTGGAGFIGSNFIINFLENDNKKENIVNIDKLTYAGNLYSLASIENDPRYIFINGDIGDIRLISNLLEDYKPRAIINFAAESHVDRSITGPEEFINTNIVGTFRLLECVKEFWFSLSKIDQKIFRFLHISTDEVYGSLGEHDQAFKEGYPYQPNSPYSASKASSDHLVRAYFKTHALPVLTTNCSNNYGPRQFPEKLIPLIIHNALHLNSLPIYGDGAQVRDWLYVDDHCSAIRLVLDSGRCGEVYNIGGSNQKRNLEVVFRICEILDEVMPLTAKSGLFSYKDLIRYVSDRPGHDRRYAIDSTKIKTELGWRPQEDFETGIRKTVEWYLDNTQWVTKVVSGEYRDWVKRQYQ